MEAEFDCSYVSIPGSLALNYITKSLLYNRDDVLVVFEY